jgi:hypothetical protein
MTLKDYLGKAVQEAGKMYLEDLEAMDEAVLQASPGGVARRPVDYSFEIAVINKRITHRLHGTDPGPWPGPEEGFIAAPPEYATKSGAIDFVRSSFDDLHAAWQTVDENDLERKIELPTGETSPLDLIAMAVSHASYHDGQLNYAQCIAGDNEVHWKF